MSRPSASPAAATAAAGASTERPQINRSQAWHALADHVHEVKRLHLRDLLTGPEAPVRNRVMRAEHDGIVLDFSRQQLTVESLDLLFDLAEAANVQGRIKSMAAGEHINTTEDRAVMHVALRASSSDVYNVDRANVVPQVHTVLQKIRGFAEQVRKGEFTGVTGKKITSVVSVGIGGSYLGAEFVHHALADDAQACKAARGRSLRFLANVDPQAVSRALDGLNPETTLVVVISKTFTTAETMLNARTLRHWLVDKLQRPARQVVPKHMVAVSAAPGKCLEFGIAAENVFELWDWVGGRYSVCSAVGMLPLALHFSFAVMREFLQGARALDQHFLHASPRENLPLILGLLGVWNSSFLGHAARALLPYSEALARFAAHIQQVDMESNGKRVDAHGRVLEFEAGEINFGEPGTNGQHSFYQLLHQGRVVPADFIGFCASQHPIALKDEPIANHDELMSNFFAQPDALAMGKTREDLEAEGVDPQLIPHKVFDGNRPSTSLLLPKLTPYTCGQLLALYEHRTAVQGFVWNVCSFDQWGVELGKALGKKVRDTLVDARQKATAPVDGRQQGYNSSTAALLNHYLGRETIGVRADKPAAAAAAE